MDCFWRRPQCQEIQEDLNFSQYIFLVEKGGYFLITVWGFCFWLCTRCLLLLLRRLLFNNHSSHTPHLTPKLTQLISNTHLILHNYSHTHLTHTSSHRNFLTHLISHFISDSGRRSTLTRSALCLWSYFCVAGAAL